MPKQVLTINDFSGGLITDVSPRDLEPNQLQACTNGDISSKGRVTSCRVFADADSAYEEAAHANEYTTGYGLFTFSNDYKISAVTTAFTDEFICNLNGTNLDITEPVTATTASVLSNMPNQPCFYAAEGDLFVGGTHSGAFNTSYKPKSSTYHYQRQFPGTEKSRTIQQWYHDQSQAKTVPVVDAGGSATQFVDWHPNDLNDNITDNNLAWVLQWGAAESGSWANDASQDSGYVQFACSWLYKNGAESDLSGLITVPDSTATLDSGADGTNRSIRVQAQIESLSAPTSGSLGDGAVETQGDLPETLRYGARLYTKMDTEATWYLLAEVSYEKGIKGSLEDDWAPWGTHDAGGLIVDALGTNSAANITATTGYIIEPPSLITFETFNGYETADIAIDANNPVYFKTAVIANSRAYIGNVRINNRDYGDRVLKSPLYQYDVFTEDSYVDVALADGDSITALTAYADRILQFREKALYIIDISKELEMLEDVRYGAGVKGPGAINKCPFGVVWANQSGCFLYNGTEVTQLSMGKIRDSEWEANIDADNVLVGYDPETRQIIVLWDGSNASSGSAYIFTLDTQSWHQVSDIIPSSHSDNCTNMVLTNDQQLLIGGGSDEGEILMMQDRAGNSTLTLQTGQLSMGTPGNKKNLTNVKVRYKYGGSDLAISIITNDDDDIGTNTDILSGSLTDTSGDVHTKSYDVQSTANFQGQYWFAVKISGTIHQTFELDEIVLTYRDIGVR